MLKALTGLVAASAMMATGSAPAMAAPVTTGAVDSSYSDLADLGWDVGDEQAGQWRRGFRNRGFRNRGWRGRNRGIGGGDILAGALLLGGIAAIASAVTNNNNSRRGPNDRFSNNDDVRSASTQCGAAAAAQSGFGARVERIDTVVRDGNGWRVEGLVGARRGGVDSFTCGISFGQIDYVQFNRANGAFGADNPDFGQGLGIADPDNLALQDGEVDYAYRPEDGDVDGDFGGLVPE